MSLFFKRANVRLHIIGEGSPSIEGILVERPNHFYRLLKPEVVHEENQNISLTGEVWVPAERVLFMQVMA